MNFPKFWARGESAGQTCWRWSRLSIEDARSLAVQAAAQLAQRFERGDFPQRHQGYYPGRPFREQVLREIKNDAGEVAAVVTRNSYGCQVLNTASVMFLDVDFPASKPAGMFARLFGQSDAKTPDDALNASVAEAEAWVREHPDWSWRIYRTRAGLRLLATHALFNPETAASDGVFDAIGADPLYRQLCLNQKCFRARLTPKPWRCGIRGKPDRWPWLDAKAEKRFQRWEAQYQSYSFNRATCDLIKSIGSSDTHPDARPIIQLHDEATRVASKLKLA